MKASRFSEAQKAFVLKQGADGVAVGGGLPEGRDQPGDLLQLEEEVRRPAADRDAAAEAARGRERQAEADRRGPDAGQGDAAGRRPPKALRPARQRKLVDEVCGGWGVSIRRACRVFLVDTSTYHYRSRRPGQAGLEAPNQGRSARRGCATAIGACMSCCGARAG